MEQNLVDEGGADLLDTRCGGIDRMHATQIYS